MRKFNLFALIFVSFFSLSQEMDEAYIASLPEDIREDVMARINAKKDTENQVYRSIDFSSDIQKKDFIDPIFGADNDYNHLSVRSAVAIYLSQLCSELGL